MVNTPSVTDSEEDEAPISTEVRARKTFLESPLTKALRDYFVFPVGDTKVEEPYEEKTLEEMGFGMQDSVVTLTNSQEPAEAIFNFWRSGFEGNATVRVATKTFKVHMMLLRACSKYFIKCDPCFEIVLPEDKVSQEAFETIYNWMLYETDLVNIDNFLDVMLAAEFLQMREVTDACWAFIGHKKYVTTEIILSVFSEAKSRDILPQLREALMSRIGKFFLQFVASDLFLQLTVPEIQSLFISNDIGVFTEMEVVMAALLWFDFDIDERRQHAGAVMKYVRFHLLTVLEVGTLSQQFKFKNALEILNDADVTMLTHKYLSDRICQKIVTTDPVVNFLGERQWIMDPVCHYHKPTKAIEEIFISYDTFLNYLKYLRRQNLNYCDSFMPKLLAEDESLPNVPQEASLKNKKMHKQ